MSFHSAVTDHFLKGDSLSPYSPFYDRIRPFGYKHVPVRYTKWASCSSNFMDPSNLLGCYIVYKEDHEFLVSLNVKQIKIKVDYVQLSFYSCKCVAFSGTLCTY